MAAKYKLWKVSIHYDAHHIDGTSHLTSNYQVVGRNESEALKKARAIFSEREWKGKELIGKGAYQSKEVRLDNYLERIGEYQTHIPLPTISGSDSAKFKLVPRILDDGGNIEYIVNKI